MFKVGDKIMLRDNWIKHDYQYFQGEILEIAYHKDSSTPMVCLISFGLYPNHWFHVMALKKE